MESVRSAVESKVGSRCNSSELQQRAGEVHRGEVPFVVAGTELNMWHIVEPRPYEALMLSHESWQGDAGTMGGRSPT